MASELRQKRFAPGVESSREPGTAGERNRAELVDSSERQARETMQDGLGQASLKPGSRGGGWL